MMAEDNCEMSQPGEPTEKAKVKSYDLTSTEDIRAMFKDKLPDDDIRKSVSEYLKALYDKHKMDDYFVIMLYDEHSSLDNFEANKIYEAASINNKSKNI
jgi:hypothetical protein